MIEIKLTKQNHTTVLQTALEVLNSGGTIIYPTETSYGLGADYYNAGAVNKVYEIKQRDKKNPLPVLIPDLTTASAIVEFSEEAYRLALEYWPGPLTLILPFKQHDWQKHFSEHLAMRISSHQFANDLVMNLGRPLVSTSANLSKQGDCYSPTEIKKQFAKSKLKPDLFINAGVLDKKLPTTIIKFTNNKSTVLRQGELKI